MKKAEIFGRIATVTGWDLEQIGRLTMSQVQGMFDYWSEHPPMHELVAAYFKVGTGQRGMRAASTADMKAFVAATGRAANV